MAKTNKTTETEGNVSDFINAVADEAKRADSIELTALMQRLSGHEAKMWGPAIIGFGSCHYKYASGREGDMPMIAFSPRKAALVLYLAMNFTDKDSFLQRLGKYKTDGGCIYIKKLADVDSTVLEELITASLSHTKQAYPV